MTELLIAPDGPVTENQTEDLARFWENQFTLAWRIIQLHAHRNARDKGFWDNERNDAEAIALMHSELSEALEGIRHGNPPSDHIPEYSAAEEEFADVIIRMLDFAGGRGFRIPEALFAKMKFNATREKMHGKKF